MKKIHRCPGGDSGRRTYLRHSWREVASWTGPSRAIRVRMIACRHCDVHKTVEKILI